MARLRPSVSRIENGFEIPTGVFEFLSKSGRKCYLSGVKKIDNNYIAVVRYIDDGTFVEVDYKKIENKLAI